MTLRIPLLGMWVGMCFSFAFTSARAAEGDTTRLQSVFLEDEQQLDEALPPDRTFKKVILFGDSLSDPGNLFSRSWHRLPGKPYWKGRFSNGPIWPEIAFKKLNIPVKNYSIAGAMTAAPYRYTSREGWWFNLYMNLRHFLTRDATSIVKQHLNDDNFDPDTAKENLYILFLGAVNYLTAGELKIFQEAMKRKDESVLNKFAEETVMDLEKLVEQLYESGARQIVVFNTPDLNLLPGDDPNLHYPKGILGLFTSLHNVWLEKSMLALKKKYPDAKIVVHKAREFFTDLVANAKSYGFETAKSSCFRGGWFGNSGMKACSNPDQHVYYDPYHPSHKAHCLFSWDIYNSLIDKGFIRQDKKAAAQILQECKA